jgi:cell division transport system ATP-binding protein
LEIRISGLTKIYPPQKIQALSNVYLNVEEGEFIYLIGTTGSGKTTLLRTLTREILPTSGHVIIDGVDLRQITNSSLPYFRRDIGVVFQDYKLLPNLTAWENVAFVLEVCGVPRDIAQERTDDVIDKVGLWNRKNLLPEQLSGGEQQRVAIARAFVNAPHLFLADEPTGNLDSHTAEYVMKLLLSIHASGTTVIVSTHDQHLVDTYRQRVVELHAGRVVRDEKEGRYSLSGDE